MNVRPSVRHVKSAERVLALLELFSLHERGLTVGEVASQLGIPQPSCSMLLRSLVQQGYLKYDRATRLFIPTIRVMLLGSWIGRRFNETASIITRLEALQEACGGETIFVAIQNAVCLQYVLVLPAETPSRFQITSGTFQSLTCSSGGRMLLSLQENDEIRGWVRRSNAEAAEDRLRVGEREFLKLMDVVRAQGYCEAVGVSDPGSAGISVAMHSPIGDMPLAIGVGGSISRIVGLHDRLLEALLRFQHDVSKQMEPKQMERGSRLGADAVPPI